MTTVTEIAPDVYRISTYASQFKLQFNHFLVKDKEPLLFHAGEVEPLVDTDLVGRARKAMIDFQSTQLLNSISYSPTTERQMAKLAALEPRTLAIMHGSSFAGDGGDAIRNLASAMKEVLGTE
jgi:hypothetical protein